ncbi:hypothetical protein [Pseudozobellia thermophila]|uniref:Uncharacterized protein n=1 Tax=Pseudozobellia thermophila TaxID=192903 RepID=A0A1M6I3S9_9FLAO|nr:hypothetical protein [Pseudozobellia thermophila]SHJ29075.1 hypothetical protein SAMN04488513_103315 [Pseudozobellia thermophila]
MNHKLKYRLAVPMALFALLQLQSQKVNEFPSKSDPLYKKVDMYDKLMLGNHWNEGAIMQHVIFPPAGLDRPIIGSQADCLDPTSEMLAAYSHKYAITKNEEDRKIANRIFEAVLKLERVTGVSGLVARSFNKTDKPLWHEKVMWYDEWHESSSMPGYRWLGDLSADKFTSIFYGVGTFWELCADEKYKKKAAGLLDRFIGRVVDNNFKLTDLDDKMTLWGNFCPDLPHQSLNSLEMLAALKVTYKITGKERFNAAYHMLIDRYHYDDDQINSKILFPEEWRNVGDDYHAARSLYMLMRFEDDPDLLNKYRMNLNRHWYDWKNIEFTWESTIWFIMVYYVLTGEDVFTEERIQAIKDMWGFERRTREFKIPQDDGSFELVKSEEEGTAAAMIRNYWFGRYYGIIDEKW